MRSRTTPTSATRDHRGPAVDFDKLRIVDVSDRLKDGRIEALNMADCRIAPEEAGPDERFGVFQVDASGFQSAGNAVRE